MIRVSVLYANEAGKKFDLDYYRNKHMTMVAERLKSYGIVKFEVDKGIGTGAPGAPAPFIAAGHLYFNALADFQKGMQAHGAAFMADIPNYTNIQPQIQISEIVA